ncbi:hydrolase [uncultured Vibrio sp.]|uniref:hydrolase n=1 Tax=uncultured Vibrio sp. TaxID=114054 RepID=UPI00090F562C|nr:hydrolase [uncultured Vibrio sp.]OIQ26460.1 MAG: hydrolase [Vibrio sp. MedPE-SWchi]
MLQRENTGLIVIDIQGKLAQLVHDSDAFIERCAKLIQGAQALDLPIIWVEQNPDKLGSTVDKLQSLLSVQSLVSPQNPISKFSFSACDEASFIKSIQSSGVKQFLVCGIETHICVYQTAMGLNKRGLGAHIVSDCVSSRTLENKDLALQKLSRNGIEITGLEMCLYELVKDCRAEEFKAILQLIK